MIKRRFFKKGFTLLELLVVVGIVFVVGGVLLVTSSQFDTGIFLTNLAYDVSLSIREAQTSAMNVREFKPNTASATFRTGYGIYFYKNNADGSRNATDYIMFADLIPSNASTGDFSYSGDSNGGAEFMKKFSTKRGNRISRFCGILLNGVEHCSVTGGILTLSIVFVGDSPDAHFKSDTGSVYKAAKIYFGPPQGGQARAIRIEKSGQIWVCNTISC